jgi:hypothetical protein
MNVIMADSCTPRHRSVWWTVLETQSTQLLAVEAFDVFSKQPRTTIEKGTEPTHFNDEAASSNSSLMAIGNTRDCPGAMLSHDWNGC